LLVGFGGDHAVLEGDALGWEYIPAELADPVAGLLVVLAPHVVCRIRVRPVKAELLRCALDDGASDLRRTLPDQLREVSSGLGELRLREVVLLDLVVPHVRSDRHAHVHPDSRSAVLAIWPTTVRPMTLTGPVMGSLGQSVIPGKRRCIVLGPVAIVVVDNGLLLLG